MTDFTPETPVLTPIHDHAAELAKAEAGVAEMAAKRNNRWHPKFHIASNGGWINDPNGLCFYKGLWHVFYQLHPYGTQWGPMHWGHVSSTDMLSWKREPIMFAPSLEQEKDGVFSGSAVVGDDGKLKFYYTGHRWANGHDNTGGDWQVQMLAEPDNDELTSATKRGMVIDCPTDKVDHHYRDPKVWKTGDKWYMTFGVSSAEKRGQMWLFSSKDMVRWEYERVLFQHPDPDVFMLECPDFFPIKDKDGNEKWVIGFSAMGSKPSGFMNRNVSNAGYMIGTWTPGEAFKPETEFRLWDCGHNYYAPQSFNDGKRQIVYGWMSPFVAPICMEDDGWCGNLTLPREITLGADGDLHTAPVAEMDGLRENTTDFGTISLGGGDGRPARGHHRPGRNQSGHQRGIDRYGRCRGYGNRDDHRFGRIHCRACGTEDPRHRGWRLHLCGLRRSDRPRGDRPSGQCPRRPRLPYGAAVRRGTGIRQAQAARVRGSWLRGSIRERRTPGYELLQLRIRRPACHQAGCRIRHAEGRIHEASPSEVHRIGVIRGSLRAPQQ